MAGELRRMTLDELAANLGDVFERVTVHREAIVVETLRGGHAVIRPFPSKPATPRRRVVTDADDEAFLATAGGWQGVDTEKIKGDIAASRRQSTRLPVELCPI
ncbi:MAG: hypothetical protein ACRDIY_22590 [Chloroflexota bacterium]